MCIEIINIQKYTTSTIYLLQNFKRKCICGFESLSHRFVFVASRSSATKTTEIESRRHRGRVPQPPKPPRTRASATVSSGTEALEVPKSSKIYRAFDVSKTSRTFLAILSRSSSVRLDPEGKHKPFSNNCSDTLPP